MTRPAHLGRLVRRLLEDRHLSQAGASRLLGCSMPFVNHLIMGRSAFPIAQLAKWVTVLRLSPEEKREFSLFAHLSHLSRDGEDLVLQRIADAQGARA